MRVRIGFIELRRFQQGIEKQPGVRLFLREFNQCFDSSCFQFHSYIWKHLSSQQILKESKTKVSFPILFWRQISATLLWFLLEKNCRQYQKENLELFSDLGDGSTFQVLLVLLIERNNSNCCIGDSFRSSEIWGSNRFVLSYIVKILNIAF